MTTWWCTWPGTGRSWRSATTGFEHVLLPADASPADLRRRAIKSADLAEWMLADTPVRRLLVLIVTPASPGRAAWISPGTRGVDRESGPARPSR